MKLKLLFVLQINGLRRNEDATAYKCWYQKKKLTNTNSHSEWTVKKNIET